MIEKIRVGIAPEVADSGFFDWTNRKIEEIRAGLTGCPRIEVEVKDGWTWLVIESKTNLEDIKPLYIGYPISEEGKNKLFSSLAEKMQLNTIKPRWMI